MTEDIVDPPEIGPGGMGFLRDPARPVLWLGRRLMPGESIRPHSHPRAQLLWATEGVLRVTSDTGVWIVPPSHAVWIPGEVRHAVRFETAVEVRNLYIDPSLSLRGGDRGCVVLLFTRLMRELVLRIGGFDMTQPFAGRLMRLAGVILDEIEALPAAPFDLPGGSDPRLVRLTRHLGEHPGDSRPFPALARIAGASSRTLERLFRAETGLSFRQWRARLRLLSAIERLHRGESSTTIAWALGYRSPSAFVAAFHAQFGLPPQSFLRDAG